MTTRVCRARRCFARFMLELTLRDYSLCHFRPSVLAAAALTVVDESLGDGHNLFGTELKDDGIEFQQALHEIRLMTQNVKLNTRITSVHDILTWYATTP